MPHLVPLKLQQGLTTMIWAYDRTSALSTIRLAWYTRQAQCPALPMMCKTTRLAHLLLVGNTLSQLAALQRWLEFRQRWLRTNRDQQLVRWRWHSRLYDVAIPVYPYIYILQKKLATAEVASNKPRPTLAVAIPVSIPIFCRSY